jgi:putative ABC transport system permease protein
MSHTKSRITFNGNYTKVIGRTFVKNRFYGILNLLGLSIGFAAFLYMVIYVHFERSFENFNSKADRIFRVTFKYNSPDNTHSEHWARVPDAFVNELPNDIPAVEKLIRFQNHERKYIRIGEQKFRPEHAYVTDNEVFDVFDFKLIAGNPKDALLHANSVVITQSLAKKYFGHEDALNKEVFIVGDWNAAEQRHIVTGVMEDLPPNTHMPVEMLMSFKNKEERVGWAYIYILLQPQAKIDQVESGLAEFIKKHNTEDGARGTQLVFQRVSDIHLHSDLAREIVPNGNAFYVKVVAFAGCFILLIGIINFMNLNSAMSLGRSKEIGMRTILGATRTQLTVYLLLESVAYHVMALLVGALICYVTFPLFQRMITIDFLINIFTLGAGMVGLAVLFGILAGIYPLYLLTSLKPISIVRNTKTMAFGRMNNPFNLKRTMVALQFSISIVLIASGIIAYNQFRFIENMNLGLDQRQIVAIPGVSDKVKSDFQAFKNEALRVSGVVSVAACMEVPSREIRDAGPVLIEGVNDDRNQAPIVDVQIIDEGFIDLMGIKIIAGTRLPESLVTTPPNSFSESYTLVDHLKSQRRGYLINETAMRRLGFNSTQEAIGKNISWSIADIDLASGPITGVVQDFHQETLKNKVDPLIMIYEPVWLRTFLIKVETSDVQHTIADLQKIWDKMFPLYPMEYYFLDDLYENLYKGERVQLQLLFISSGLAILIAFIGLVGLVAYALKTRVREIAIRKVMGANNNDLVNLFSKEYVVILLVAVVCAIPVSYYGSSQWLSNFAYHVDISPATYLLTLTVILAMLVVTIALQILRSAVDNPGETLRNE